MIDPQAIVHPNARLADDVQVGPFTTIGADVEISAGCRIGAPVVLEGPTRLGHDNRVHSFAAVGVDPQDKKFRGETSRLEIGDGITIREYCTISRGTGEGGGVTRIGDRNWIMAYCHIAHDCQVNNHATFANGSSLAGHVEIGSHAILGGFTLVHQFCRIGAYSFCSMSSAVRQDVPPFVTVAGDPAVPRGLNAEGLRREGFSPDRLQALKSAYRILYRSGMSLTAALDALTTLGIENPDLATLAGFIDGSHRGIVRP